MDGPRLKGRMPESSEPAGPTNRAIVFMRLLFFLGLFSLKNTKDETGTLHNISGETAVSREQKARIPRTTWRVRDTCLTGRGSHRLRPQSHQTHSPAARARLTAAGEPPGVRAARGRTPSAPTVPLASPGHAAQAGP